MRNIGLKINNLKYISNHIYKKEGNIMKPNNKLIRECSKVEHITFNDKTRKAVVRAYAELFQTLQKPLIILMTQ